MADFRLDVNIDTSRLQARTLREQKRLAYSVAQALNAATKDVQLAERANLDRKFKIRKAGFMYRLIKITQFATVNKGIPFAELAVDNTKARVLLGEFEAGGIKHAVKGKNVAVPITGLAARPSWGDTVPDAMTFKALSFKRVRLTGEGEAFIANARQMGKGFTRFAKRIARRQEQIWAGANRTFILPHTIKAPFGGVFQRVGPKRDDIRLIYSFKPNPKLDKKLNFVDIARAQFGPAFTRYFNELYTPE